MHCRGKKEMVARKKTKIKGKEKLMVGGRASFRRVVAGKKGKEEGMAEKGENEEEMEADIENVEEEVKKLQSVLSNIKGEEVKVAVKGSKPISMIKKRDKIRVDGAELEVDAHYVLIDHGNTKEMTIELFDPKTDKEYQLRYFSDQVGTSLEFYELEEIIYVKKNVSKIEW